MGRLSMASRFLDRWKSRFLKPIVSKTGPLRRSISLGGRELLGTEVFNETGDTELVYRWRTNMSPVDLIKKCDAYVKGQLLSEDVEVVVYQPKIETISLPELVRKRWREGLEPSVRFNVENARLGDFSIVWARDENRGDQLGRAFVEAVISSSARGMMREMIEGSLAIPHPKALGTMVTEGDRLLAAAEQ